MSSVIETRDLSKWYGNVLGLSDVSIQIDKGITGILGPNGAGKTTFLRLISGQIKPKIGSVSIYGKPVWNHPSLFSSIGYCPEQDAFYDELTGQQFLSGLLKLHHFSSQEIEQRALKTLELVDLVEDKDRVIKSYSRGMRQRIKIAQAIAHDPDLLVLDEPLNGLDPLGRRRIIRLIKSFQQEGKTIIVSSHVLPEIEAMTRNIVLIHQGKIFAQGDIHYIRDLIETHPHIVSIKCSRPRQLAGCLLPEDCVLKVQFRPDGETLLFETDDRDRFFSLLPSVVKKEDLDIREITSPDDNLQAVFDYLVGK